MGQHVNSKWVKVKAGEIRTDRQGMNQSVELIKETGYESEW